jgi:MarR family transcriptional regulator, lower aerobic nicotinate degradation pathway regulator
MKTPAEDAAAPNRLTSQPSWLITQTAAHAHRLVSDGLAEVGSRGYHYRLLATLDEGGPGSQADLGRRSGIHFSDIVATINELVERRLVEREPDPVDRRRNIITITAAGRRHLRRLDAQLAAIQDDLLAPLSADERATLTRLLDRVLEFHTRRSPAVG